MWSKRLDCNTGDKRIMAASAAMQLSGNNPNYCFESASHLCGVKRCINPKHLVWGTTRYQPNEEYLSTPEMGSLST